MDCIKCDPGFFIFFEQKLLEYSGVKLRVTLFRLYNFHNEYEHDSAEKELPRKEEVEDINKVKWNKKKICSTR